MNPNIPTANTDTNPFGQPQADPTEAAHWAAEVAKENKTSTRIRRSIGDKMLKLVGKGNKVAKLHGHEDAVSAQAATRESVDAVLANPRGSTKKERALAADLQSGYDVMDSQQASKDFRQGQAEADIAAIDRQLSVLYTDPHADSNVSSGIPAGRVINELQKRREAAVQQRDAVAAESINTTWADSANSFVAGEQRRNVHYNAAEQKAPEVKPEDMPGYNPFASVGSQPTPPAENPFK